VASIHPTAVVDSRAEISSGVSIGPFCVIEPDVTIGPECQLASHVVIKRGTQLGKGNVISEGAVLGGKPQHLQAGDQIGGLRVGCDNVIRENVTIHCALGQNDVTRIGDRNLLMVNSHVAHDCHLEDHVILANNVMLAGHVKVESRAYLAGAAGVHQFCRIGQLAMVGGQAHLSQDVPPFLMVDGISSEAVGLNRIGLKRAGFTTDQVNELKEAYRLIYRSGMPWTELVERLRVEFPDGPGAAYHVFFQDVRRGIIRERRRPPKSMIRLFPNEQDDKQPHPIRNAS
jgi:UDP-N-acetylglucosamine acyltransferase